jgi:hypothetical protein
MSNTYRKNQLAGTHFEKQFPDGECSEVVIDQSTYPEREYINVDLKSLDKAGDLEFYWWYSFLIRFVILN